MLPKLLSNILAVFSLGYIGLTGVASESLCASNSSQRIRVRMSWGHQIAQRKLYYVKLVSSTPEVEIQNIVG